ncbi:DUF2690 domain-containing protein [Kitasatospora sp. NPDC028055]|uniref:DUF2690 domain-containing protein n=1 Tax=unclassified Kitasatospora TaxID=2633591 RepID=UPI0033DA0C8E
MRVSRAALALVLATATALLPPLLAPAPAVAAETCHGNACDGLSPKATGCAADAQTIPGTAVPPGHAEAVHAWLRYSKKCHAVWAQADQSNGWGFRLQTSKVSYDGTTVMSGPTYTAMSGADQRHRVGLQDAGDGQWTYGAWRTGGV